MIAHYGAKPLAMRGRANTPATYRRAHRLATPGHRSPPTSEEKLFREVRKSMNVRTLADRYFRLG
jgi:hypothetical protein